MSLTMDNDDFINELNYVQECYIKNVLSLHKFSFSITKSMLEKGISIESINIYLASILSNTNCSEKTVKKCVKKMKKAYVHFNKDKNKDKLDKLIEFIEANNKILLPAVRNGTFIKSLKLMNTLELVKLEDCNRRIAKKNIRINKFRNKIPESFLYKELEDIKLEYRGTFKSVTKSVTKI